MGNNVKKKSLLSKIKSSPSLKSWDGTKKLIKAITGNLYHDVAYITVGVPQVDFWKEDKKFVDLYREAGTNTLLPPNRFLSLYQFALNTVNLEGETAELGVYKGGSAKMLSRLFTEFSPDKKVLLFDTFGGMPVTDGDFDLHQEGDFDDVNLDYVKNFMKDCNNVEFHQGLFSDTLPKIDYEKFCFIHIDADIYPSVKECTEFFYPKMVSGGVIIYDDYGLVSCPGAKKAVDEYFADKSETPIYLLTGQAVVIKH